MSWSIVGTMIPVDVGLAVIASLIWSTPLPLVLFARRRKSWEWRRRVLSSPEDAVAAFEWLG